MEDISFDINEIQGTGQFGFDNDFDLNDPEDAFDPQEQVFEEEEPQQELNIQIETNNSQDEDGCNNMNDIAIDNYGDEDDDSNNDVADEMEEQRRGSIF